MRGKKQTCKLTFTWSILFNPILAIYTDNMYYTGIFERSCLHNRSEVKLNTSHAQRKIGRREKSLTLAKLGRVLYGEMFWPS